jgi:hypothetical protein
MGNQPVSSLTALTGANTALNDVMLISDTSATASRKIALDQLAIAVSKAAGTESVAALSTTAIESLQNTLIASLTTTQIQSLSTTQLGALTTTQVAGILTSAGVPTTGNTLKYDGVAWVVGEPSSVAGSAVTMYLDDTVMSSDNATLQTVPSAIAENTTLVAVDADVDGGVTFIERYASAALGRTTIPAGIWNFHSWVLLTAVTGDNYLKIRINQRVLKPGITVTFTGAGATRTLTASGGAPFVAGDANASIMLAALIETPTQTAWISGYTSPTEVTVTLTDPAFVNVSGVDLTAMLYLLFTYTSADITTAGSVVELESQMFQPAFVIGATDSIVAAYFAVTTSGTARNFTLYNGGSNYYTHFDTPFITQHNDMDGLQGGAGDERYHLTAAQQADVAVLSSTFTTAQIAAFQTAAGGSLTTTQMADWATAEVAALSTIYVSSLESTLIQQMTSVHVGLLTTAALQGLTATQFASLPTTAIAGMTSTQMAAFSTTALSGLQGVIAAPALLTTTQIAGLGTTQIDGMSSAVAQAIFFKGGGGVIELASITGGTLTGPINGKYYYKVTVDGNLVIPAPRSIIGATAPYFIGTSLICNAFMIGGGGSGGSVCGGGGGAGGDYKVDGLTLTPGSYPVDIGAGGAGYVGQVQANNGSPSTFNGQTSLGGGGGGCYNGVKGRDGGCGGGASENNTGNRGIGSPGYDGGVGSGSGDSGGGGGGLGAVGGNASGITGGAGGIGINWKSTGTYYGGGGGGGKGSGPGGLGGGGVGAIYSEGDENGGNATANTGGGGGGGGRGLGSLSGNGGSGILVLEITV